MIREIIRPASSEYIIHIPNENIYKGVENLVLSIGKDLQIGKSIGKELINIDIKDIF